MRFSSQNEIWRAMREEFLAAAQKHYGEDADVNLTMDRRSGTFSLTVNGVPIDFEAFGKTVGDSVKRELIERIRKYEREALEEGDV